MKTVLTAVILTALLCGCGSQPKWKKETFAFSTPTDPPAVNTGTNIIALNRVTVSPLFRSQDFTYRVGDDAYERDPYGAFLVPPERTLAETLRACMRCNKAFGKVDEPESGLIPNRIAEATVDELCGDFRSCAHPAGVLEIHFVIYEANDGVAGRVLLDKTYAEQTLLPKKSPAALMTAWETDLRKIMEKLDSDYAKASPQ
jgi:hypothetical protein